MVGTMTESSWLNVSGKRSRSSSQQFASEKTKIIYRLCSVKPCSYYYSVHAELSKWCTFQIISEYKISMGRISCDVKCLSSVENAQCNMSCDVKCFFMTSNVRFWCRFWCRVWCHCSQPIYLTSKYIFIDLGKCAPQANKLSLLRENGVNLKNNVTT